MNAQNFVVATAVLLLSSVGSAHATTTTLTLDDVFSYSYTSIKGNGPKITDDLSKSSTIKLNTPTSDKNFFTAAPASSSGITCGKKGEPSCGNGYDTASGTITISLDFTLVQTVKNGKTITTTTLGTGDLSDVIGTYVADYDGNADYDGTSCTSSTGSETDCIVWFGEKSGATSITIPVELTNGDDVDVTLFNAQDWDITPKISFDLTACTNDCTIGGHSNATPLPPTLPLFAAGLGAMGLLGWRSKRKVKAIAN